LGSLLPFCLDGNMKSIVLTNQRTPIQNVSPNSEHESKFGYVCHCALSVYLVSFAQAFGHKMPLLVAPTNENSIDDSPVETLPVLLLIKQTHDAELAPFASTSCMNNQAV
jgi:hypothetical protein